MRHTFRTTAVATAAVVLAGLTVIPLTATPASAVALGTETEYYLSDSDGDFNYELWKRTTPTGSATLVAGTKSATLTLSDLSASRDGSRFVYLQTTMDSNGNPLRDQVVVRDVSGLGVRVVSDVLESPTAGSYSPAISPDGNTVVWSAFTATGINLVKAAAGAGGSTLVKAGYFSPVFLDADTLLARNGAGSWETVPLAGGATNATTLPSNAYDVTVSADGTHLAWSEDTTTGAATTSDVKTATLSVTSGVATIGAATTVATGLENDAPSFSRDGSTVYFVKWDGEAGPGDVWSTPAAGPSTSAAATVTTVADELDVAIGTTDAANPPGDPTASPATLLGTSATLHWTLPVDADLSGVLISRALSGGATQKTFYWPAPLTAYTDTGLVLGSTYTYTITSVDRSGNLGATPATRQLTAVQAKPFAYSPTATRFTRTPFTVGFSASAVPSGVLWTVTYRTNSGATWYSWINGVAGTSRTFGSAATTGINATSSYPGVTYQFRVSAVDAYGNSTPVATSTPEVVPFDQTKGSFSGGATYAMSSAWLGSYRLMKVAGSYAKVTLTGNAFFLIGARCATCGVIEVYDGSRLVQVIDTYHATTQPRQVIAAYGYPSVSTHTYTIKVRGTSGRPNVIIDGFGMRR